MPRRGLRRVQISMPGSVLESKGGSVFASAEASQLRRGGHGDPNKSGQTMAITGQTNVQQFPCLANSPSHKPKKIQNENRRRSTPLCCQIARIVPPEVSQNVLSSLKSSR